MIHFEGEQRISRRLSDVVASLGDASFLLGTFAGVESVAESTADRAVWTLRPAFAFAAGKLECVLEVVERGPDSARYVVTSKGVGATSTVETSLKCEPVGDDTVVKWVADITALTGLLKMVPQTLIKGAAGKIVQETWASIAAKLNR